MLRRASLLFLVPLLAPLASCSSGGGASGGGGGDDGSGNTSSATESTGAQNGTGTANGPTTGTGMAECTINTECPMGEICQAGACVAGCASDQPCPVGSMCCEGQCFDPMNDPLHCGTCDNDCPDAANVATTCVDGICGLGACDPGFADCDGMAGCETMGMCVCTPGMTQPCYQGPVGTENVGTCVAGTQTCNANGNGYGLCMNQVLPTSEVCADNLDNDCNGVADDISDLDGDGWTICDGDCCDEIGVVCGTPALVNPGAFEYVGNMVDDDCDFGTPDASAPAACSTVSKFTGVTPMDVANAIDLCQTTAANPPLPLKKWGVITAEYRLANGASPPAAQLTNMQNFQAAVMTQYGTNATNLPQLGPTLAGISSGRMRDANDTGYVAPNSGTDFASDSTPNANYLAQHGGALPSSAGCSGNCPAGSGANDSINVRLDIRVPTNAQSFSYKFRFFSSEYWTWSCTAYNDFYLALLTSAAVGIPADKNISFDSSNNPVSVNNGFFDVCQAKGCYTCPSGTAALAGTGMDNVAGGGVTGGATNWLTTSAPIVPGETMTIEFQVFDVSDNILDSLSLLDAFQWSVTPSAVGTVEN